mmetsp:Transcript_829/g.3215  ORF Transcript_829/g.3215 Transcript_829/m.3215 type:complete len:208 (-) Transcript_829:822-1445(-)
MGDARASTRADASEISSLSAPRLLRAAAAPWEDGSALLPPAPAPCPSVPAARASATRRDSFATSLSNSATDSCRGSPEACASRITTRDVVTGGTVALARVAEAGRAVSPTGGAAALAPPAELADVGLAALRPGGAAEPARCRSGDRIAAVAEWYTSSRDGRCRGEDGAAGSARCGFRSAAFCATLASCFAISRPYGVVKSEGYLTSV